MFIAECEARLQHVIGMPWRLDITSNCKAKWFIGDTDCAEVSGYSAGSTCCDDHLFGIHLARSARAFDSNTSNHIIFDNRSCRRLKRHRCSCRFGGADELCIKALAGPNGAVSGKPIGFGPWQLT